MSKETYYFSHDYNARSDSKVADLLMNLGMCGYGVYWSIIEDLYNNDNALPANYKLIAYNLRTEEQLVKDVLNNFRLFDIEEGIVSSKSVAKRLNMRNEKKRKRAEAGSKGGKTRAQNAAEEKAKQDAQLDGFQAMLEDSQAMLETGASNACEISSKLKQGKERKGKEIKLKDNKEDREENFKPSDFVNAPDLKPFQSNPDEKRKKTYLDCVYLTEQEHEALLRLHGKEKTDYMLNLLNNYKQTKSEFKCESDYHYLGAGMWIPEKANKHFLNNPSAVSKEAPRRGNFNLADIIRKQNAQA